jgi:DNA-directed RNA polymerase subunit RPC12/RpoP
MENKKGPKILLLDIETAPILASVWSIWNVDVPLNMIEKDWHLLAVCCKWLDDPASKAMYYDQRNAKNIEDDTKLLQFVHNLLDECDVVVTQNGKAFDIKKLNARFITKGLSKPSRFEHIDTKKIASRNFAFTSNKLEYLADVLNLPKRKSKHKNFPGFSLWQECLKGNKKAWDEMKHYNIQDVLVLEDLYKKFRSWDNDGVNVGAYYEDTEVRCSSCGGTHLVKDGIKALKNGKYQRYQCKSCGTKVRGTINLLLKEHKPKTKQL